MNASLRTLRRGIACGSLVTFATLLSGCFSVEEVAQAPGADDAAASVAEPSIDFGVEAGALDDGPLTMDIDSTVGDVSGSEYRPPASAGSSFGTPTGGIVSPPAFGTPAVKPTETAADSTTFQPSGFEPSAPSKPAPGGDFSAGGRFPSESTPAAPSKGFDAAPRFGSSTLPTESFAAPADATPTTAPAFDDAPAAIATADDGTFQPSSNPTFDPTGNAQPPMREFDADEPKLAANDDAPAENSFAPALTPLPSVDADSTPDESTPDEAALTETPVEDSTENDAEASPSIFDSARLAMRDLADGLSVTPMPDPRPAAPVEESTGEPADEQPVLGALAEAASSLILGDGSQADADSRPQLETLPPTKPTELAAPLADVAPSLAAPSLGSPETLPDPVAGSPFEEDDFAPRFGPGRFAQTPPAEGLTPQAIADAAPSLDDSNLEADGPDALPSPSPASASRPGRTDLAMQLIDPSAPPPASIRPDSGPPGTLPDFDPTRGANLAPPAADLDEYVPVPGDDAGPPAGTPSGARPLPRVVPTPGPARDSAGSNDVSPASPVRPTTPAPNAPGRTLPDGDDSEAKAPDAKSTSPKRASTPSEIADAARKWTDASGSFSIDAAILEHEDGDVRLETPEGELYSVKLASLSRYDQGYVKGLAEGTLGKKPATRSWTDSTGSFGVLGELFEDDGDVVRILRDDGKKVRIERDLLGDYDRGYVDGIADAKEQ